MPLRKTLQIALLLTLAGLLFAVCFTWSVQHRVFEPQAKTPEQQRVVAYIKAHEPNPDTYEATVFAPPTPLTPKELSELGLTDTNAAGVKISHTYWIAFGEGRWQKTRVFAVYNGGRSVQELDSK